VTLAVVGAPHGVRGELRLKTFTEDPLAILAYGEVETADGRRLRVAGARPLKGDMIVARFENVTSREAAEALNGAELLLGRDRLPEPEEEEFYLADLIGLEAVTPEGSSLGRVLAVPNFGAGDLLEIGPEDARSGELVPFTREVVPQIDIARGRLVVRRPVEVERAEDLDGSVGPLP